MKLYNNNSKFTTEEFACKCGCGLGTKEVDISEDLISKLNLLRNLYGKSMVVKSGARCQEHNKKEGGKPLSAHTPGEKLNQCRAVDIAIGTSTDRFKFIDLALKVGFKRIGIAHTFVHLDTAVDLPQAVLFLY